VNVITAQQCKEARFHLRWNIRDLAHHSAIAARRIEWFEEGREPLYQEEMNSLTALFKSKDIIFSEGGGVKKLEKPKNKHTQHHNTHNNAASAVLQKLLNKDVSDDNNI
jgi:shikimate kinase